jgi:hypothetical protein
MRDSTEHDVYVDVVFDDGLLYLVICNDGTVAARQVRITFDRPLLGEDGVDVGRLGVFTRLEFLAPGKRVPVFLDRATDYFARRQKSQFTMKVAWQASAERFVAVITHDMRAYADLPYIIHQPDNRRIGHLRR